LNQDKIIPIKFNAINNPCFYFEK